MELNNSYFLGNHTKPKSILTGWSLANIDPDHLFAVWWIYHGVPVTPATRAKGWCVYREIELDF